MESDHPDATADVNVLMVNKNVKTTQDVENRNCAVIHGVEYEKMARTRTLW